MPRLALHLAATAVAAAAFAGCAAPAAQPPAAEQSATTAPVPPSTPPAPAEPPADVPTVTSVAPDSPAAPAQPTAVPADEQPVAVREGSIDKVRVTGSLYGIRRSSGVVTVNLLVKSVDTTETFRVVSSFSDGDKETSGLESSVDGLRLVDTASKKAYLPATTGDGDCLCTPSGETVWEDHNQVWISVVFAAPPETLAAIDVLIPVFGTVHNVPVR